MEGSVHKQMRNVGVISLGCAKNQVDTERMLGLLAQAGFAIVNDPELAHILIVNTCGFIEPAKQESINAILEMAQYKRTGVCDTLVVTGCLSQRYPDELREALPEVDVFLGVRDYARLPAILTERAADADALPLGCASPRVLTTPPYRAYLRIADGCDNRCAYCAIPLIRGPLRCEPFDALLAEARRLADAGVTEITVIAQDTSCYGKDLYGKPRLAELLTALAAIEPIHWVRVLYTYPDTVTTALIDAIRENPKLCNYLDLPLQHADDAMLSAMHRRGTMDSVRRVLDYTAEHAPDFMLRTTMMVGFPGETDAMFENMLAFLREHPFDRVGAFAFSPEDGTEAAAMPGQVPEDVKQARLAALMEQQQGISRRRAERRVGSACEVLIEGAEGAYTLGRSYAEAPDDADGRILLPRDDALSPGQYVSARLDRALYYDMVGERV